ncbi:MAG: amidase family protein, partial [Alphaproteobacteria bacterium]
MSDLADKSARALAQGYREYAFSPVEVMQAVLARCEARKDLNAFVTLIPEQAMQAAREAEALQASGADLPALHGLPYSVKDLTLTKGVRT